MKSNRKYREDLSDSISKFLSEYALVYQVNFTLVAYQTEKEVTDVFLAIDDHENEQHRIRFLQVVSRYLLICLDKSNLHIQYVNR